MTFSEVLAFLRRGRQIARPSWGKAYVFLAGGGRSIQGKILAENTKQKPDEPCVYLHGSPEEDLPVDPVLCFRTNQDTIVLGWRPTADDLLAEDWEPEPW